MDLGLRLKLVRQKRRLKQKDLAARAGITPKYLSHLENHVNAMQGVSLDIFRKLVQELGVKAEYLLGLSDEDGIDVRPKGDMAA